MPKISNFNKSSLFNIALPFFLVIYILLSLIFSLFISSSPDIASKILLQTVFIVSFILFFYTLQKLDWLYVYLLIFIYHFSLCYLYNIFTENSLGEFWGFAENDGYKYYLYTLSLSNVSYDYLLQFYRHNINDLGFILVLRFLKMFVSSGYIFDALIIVNSICMTLFSFLCKDIFANFLNTKLCKQAVLFVSLSPYTIFVTTNWLKENVFILLVTLAFYLYFRYTRSDKIKTIYSLGISCLTFFFRSITPFMLLSTFSMQVLPDKFLRKHFVLILVVVSLIILVCLSPFLTLLGFEGGINKILTVSSNRASGISYNLFYVFLIQFVSSIWGPFPNLCFVYNGPFYIYDYYIFLNCILSFYFIFGVFALYTTFHKFMPYIFMYIFLNLLAVIVSVVALDFRFQLTYFPLFTLVSFYGFQEQSKQFSALTNMLCFIVYLIIIAAIIIMYNSRHFT